MYSSVVLSIFTLLWKISRTFSSEKKVHLKLYPLNSSHFPPPLSPWESPFYFLFLWMWLLCISPISGIRQHLSLCGEGLVAKSCLTLYDPMGCSPPGSSLHGTFQARILEWVAIPSSRGSSQPKDWTWIFCIAGSFFTDWATREAHLA